MARFADLERCADLSEEDVAAAVSDRASLRALMERMAAIARPDEGASRLLAVFGRMATTACDWLDGDLRIELVGDATTTVIDVLTDLGGGLRERAVPSAVLGVSLGELISAIERAPELVRPLTITMRTERRVVLSASAEVRRSSLPPAIPALDAPVRPRRAAPAVPAVPPRVARTDVVRTPRVSDLPEPREPSFLPAAYDADAAPERESPPPRSRKR